MEEELSNDVDDVDLAPNLDMLTPVEVDMVVDDQPLIFTDDKNDEPVVDHNADPSLDPVQLALSMYTNEMMDSGLTSSDLDYFARTYTILDSIRFQKMHCTSCDKHLGTSPLAKQDRYCHPLLKVLMCEDCYVFYCSGEFDTDEDGSELYCRWCGEGGQVFCCTKCPYVFCKRCITRNLGRGVATIIQNSEDWMCFSCNPVQINKHRASYWAVQKYSDLKMSQTCDEDELSKDFSNCCSKGKKRVTEKSDEEVVEVAPKKRRTSRRHEKKEDEEWRPSPETVQDEVVCTPDILPLSESPIPSPSIEPDTSNSPSPIPTLRILSPAKVNSQVKVTMDPFCNKEIICDKWKKVIPKDLTPQTTPKPSTDNNDVQFVKQTVLQTTLQKPAMNIVKTMPIIKPKPVYTPINMKKKPLYSDKDWLNNAVIDSKQVNEYMAAKIATITSFKRKSPEELYNMFQVYLDVATEKLQKIKEKLQSEYVNVNPHRMAGVLSASPLKPIAIVKPPPIQLEETSIIVSDSDDDEPPPPKVEVKKPESQPLIETRLKSSLKPKPPEEVKKPSINNAVVVVDVKPEDILFDMDVTNASDEETTASSDNDDDYRDEQDDDDNDVEITEEKKEDELKTEETGVKNVIASEEQSPSKEKAKESIEEPEVEKKDTEKVEKEKVEEPKVADQEQQDKEVNIDQETNADKENKEMNADKEDKKTNADEEDKETNGDQKIEKASVDQENKGETEEREEKELMREEAQIEKPEPVVNHDEPQDIPLDLQVKNRIREDKLEEHKNSQTNDKKQMKEAKEVEEELQEQTPRNSKSTVKVRDLSPSDLQRYLCAKVVMEKANIEKLCTSKNASDDEENPENHDKITNEHDEVPYNGDFEEILAGNIVMRSQTVTSKTSFEDVFSKFVNTSVPPKGNPNEIQVQSSAVSESDESENFELPPEDADDSLSLPPHSAITIKPKLNIRSNLKNPNIEQVIREDGQVLNNNDNVDLENELVALRHLAETCVPSTLSMQNASAEVKSCDG